jgi:hypothetical protein
MRVLVIGSLPPPERPRSEALRAEVTGLLADGHAVEVVAPDPVATAHRYLALTGLPGCLQLLWMISGFDSVIVQLQPGLPVRSRAGRFERVVSLFAFSLVVRRGHEVVLRLQSLADLPGGVGGAAAFRLWRRADRIVIGSDDELALFAEAVGKKAARLEVTASRVREGDDDAEGWGDAAEPFVEDVLALVRKRAALERRALGSVEMPHVSGWDQLAAPGLAMTEADAAGLGSGESPRKPADLARRALAAADRRPSLWRLARGVRLARRGAYGLLRPERSE